MSKGKWCRRRLLCSDNGGSRDLIIALTYRLYLSTFKKVFFKIFYSLRRWSFVFGQKVFRFLAMVFLSIFRLRFL